MISSFLKEITGINLLDIGSSGQLSEKFSNLYKYINLTGFDPNEEECARMNNAPNPYLSAKYLPYAIAGDNKIATLYKTSSIYCYSLLKPNSEWLRRFSYFELFNIEETEEIEVKKLSSVDEIQHSLIDVIKTDTQGLELPILSSGRQFLDSAFYVETETGFVENYIHETTFSQIDVFMRENYFLLFDINTNHRVSRNNSLKEYNNSEEILWCEATWLKDYVSLYQSGRIPQSPLNREKALKSLILCALQGCFSYGYELALLYKELGLLDNSELNALSQRQNWRLPDEITKEITANKKRSRIINYCLRLLPFKLREKIRQEATIAINQKHLFKR